MPTNDTDFPLHPKLATDCHLIGALPASLLLLHRNPALHWFILVPRTTKLDLLDLPTGDREALLDDASGVARYLKETLDYPRVNVGALGLVVPQLHLHVVGRREGDPCWPSPVWGQLPESDRRYSDSALETLQNALLPL